MNDPRGRPQDISDVGLDEDAEAECRGEAEMHGAVVELVVQHDAEAPEMHDAEAPDAPAEAA